MEGQWDSGEMGVNLRLPASETSSTPEGFSFLRRISLLAYLCGEFYKSLMEKHRNMLVEY